MNQKYIWNRIAPEWHRFRTKPDEEAMKFLKSQKGNIVDFGSGSGRNLVNLKKKGKLFLVDFSEEMIKLAKERAKELGINAEFYVMSLTRTGFEDGFFDSAIFISALHCIPGERNRKRAIMELFRIMKPGAEVFVSVWNKDSSWFKNKPKEKFMSWRDKGERYYYLYDTEEVYSAFEKLGFKIIKKITPEKNIMFIAKKI